MTKKESFKQDFVDSLIVNCIVSNIEVERIGHRNGLLGSSATRYVREMAETKFITHPEKNGKIDEFRWIMNGYCATNNGGNF